MKNRGLAYALQGLIGFGQGAMQGMQAKRQAEQAALDNELKRQTLDLTKRKLEADLAGEYEDLSALGANPAVSQLGFGPDVLKKVRKGSVLGNVLTSRLSPKKGTMDLSAGQIAGLKDVLSGKRKPTPEEAGLPIPSGYSNFFNQPRPAAGVPANVLRAQGFNIDPSVPDDFVFPTGSIRAFQAPKQVVDKAPKGYRYTADGNLEVIPGGPEDKKKATALTPGQKKVDENYAKEYADYYASGGRASVEADLKNIETLPDELRGLKRGTGGFIGVLPKEVRDYLNPGVSDVQERFEKTAQKALKKILGGQFAEKEAKEFFARSFNPRLPSETNAKRIEASIQELKDMAEDRDAAAQYYQANGTLAGFVPSRRNPSDARAESAKKLKIDTSKIDKFPVPKSQKSGGLMAPEQRKRLEELRKKYGR